MASNIEISETLEWYYVDSSDPTQLTKGPISERDIDVLWRTSAFVSTTMLWKEGMTTWKPLNELTELREKLMESTKEMLEITHKKHDDKPMTPKKHPIPSKLKEVEVNLEKEVEKLIANSAYQNPSDGLWYVYDHEKKNWRTQDEDPNATLESLSAEKLGQDKGGLLERSKKITKIEKVVAPVSEEELKKLEKLKKKTKKAAEKKKKTWYEPKINSNVYVKGLPEDITMEELKEFFTKAGVLRFDAKTGDHRIKLYKDDQNHFKGDALVSYIKEESVELAKEMLDQREIKPGFKISIDRAKFEQKGDYIPRKKVEIDKINLIKQKTDQEKLLSWNEGEDNDDKGLKIVILTHVFTLEESQQEENYFRDLELDIKDECETKLGPIQRLKIFENNPQGVILIKFKNSTSADECIKLMNGRFFSGRRLECFFYDGKTNYDRKVALEEEEKRIEEFGKWLEGKE